MGKETSLERHFTAGAYIIDEEKKVLLIYHRKLKKWLPTGGHVELNETPAEAAIREAKEETGLDVEIILQENIWINQANAASFPRPFLCLLEEIPAFGNEPAHQHIDFVYVTRILGGIQQENYQEIEKMRWFTFEELELLTPEVDIFQESLNVINAIFTHLGMETICT